ncbi:hypothetical protein FQA39_LY15655 [Lamprigera yunnana]|nr:hypothetical protein FQA39_LY15655 [Lamprigera yunnana]
MYKVGLWNYVPNRRRRFIIILPFTERRLLRNTLFPRLWESHMVDVVCLYHDENKIKLYTSDPEHPANDCGWEAAYMMEYECNQAKKIQFPKLWRNYKNCELNYWNRNGVQRLEKLNEAYFKAYFVLETARQHLNFTLIGNISNGYSTVLFYSDNSYDYGFYNSTEISFINIDARRNIYNLENYRIGKDIIVISVSKTEQLSKLIKKMRKVGLWSYISTRIRRFIIILPFRNEWQYLRILFPYLWTLQMVDVVCLYYDEKKIKLYTSDPEHPDHECGFTAKFMNEYRCNFTEKIKFPKLWRNYENCELTYWNQVGVQGLGHLSGTYFRAYFVLEIARQHLNFTIVENTEQNITEKLRFFTFICHISIYSEHEVTQTAESKRIRLPPSRYENDIDSEMTETDNNLNVSEKDESIIQALQVENKAWKVQLHLLTDKNEEVVELNIKLQKEMLSNWNEMKLTLNGLKENHIIPEVNMQDKPVGYTFDDRIHLGRNIWLPLQIYNSIDVRSKSNGAFVRALACAVFGSNTLTLSSVTDKSAIGRKGKLLYLWILQS